MAGTLFGLPLSQRVDANGDPEVGWLLYLYQANTSTPVNSYQDTGLTVLNTWPVQADAFGMMGVFWLADGSYRARGTSNDGATVFFDLPNILAIGASIGAAPPSGVDPNAIFKTGDTIWLDQEGIRSGWVRDNGLTIGSATSGATEPGGNVAAAQPLFEFLWNTYSNTICPVITGRGGSSLSDWTANKKLTLPDKRGYMPIGADAMGNASSGRFNGVYAPTSIVVPGSGVGENTHTLTIPEMPAHDHPASQAAHDHDLGDGFDAFGTTGVQGPGGTPVLNVVNNSGAGRTGFTAAPAITISGTGGSVTHNNVPLAIIGTFYRKL